MRLYNIRGPLLNIDATVISLNIQKIFQRNFRGSIFAGNFVLANLKASSIREKLDTRTMAAFYYYNITQTKILLRSVHLTL